MEDIPLNIEQMIIATGSYLYNAGNSGNSIIDIDDEFLSDLRLLIDAELERREATTHRIRLRKARGNHE